MISSRDLRVILRELENLQNAVLDNFYGGFREIYAFKFRRPGYGTDYVIVDLSVPTFHSSTIRPAFPQMPPGKIMNFRKHIKGQRVEYAYPEENERIVHILLANGIDVVVELFGGGNVILVRDGKIFMALKYREYSARSIKPGEPYKLPPQPERFTPEFTIVRGLVSDLVRRYGIPPKYAREIAFRAGLPEDAKELSDEEKRRVYEAYAEVLNEIENAEGGFVYDKVVSPIELLHLGEPKEKYDTFNEAVDSVYVRIYERMLKEEVTRKYSEARKKVERIIETQKAGLRRLEEKLSKLTSLYEGLSVRLHLLDELLETIKRARKRFDRDEIDAKLRAAKAMGIESAALYESVRPKEGKIVVNVDGIRYPIDLRMSAYEVLSSIAEEIKRTRSKIERVRGVIEEKLKELENIEERIERESRVEVERRKRKKRKRRHRYERFRRIKLENALIVGGKDAKTNEELIRRRMEPNDLVFHADYYGAPFVLLKGEKTEEAIREAALLAGAFSRARKDGLNYISVYYVRPEQVMLGAPHKQYVGRGAFVIRGKRNYLDVVLRRAVGENVRGSPERVKRLSKRRIVLAPGGSQKEYAEARKIAYELTGYDRVVPASSYIIEKNLRACFLGFR